jgi:hypothetical protein
VPVDTIQTCSFMGPSVGHEEHHGVVAIQTSAVLVLLMMVVTVGFVQLQGEAQVTAAPRSPLSTVPEGSGCGVHLRPTRVLTCCLHE